MGQEYYRRRLKANKMKRKIASTRASIRNFRVLLRLILIILIIFCSLKVLKSHYWYINKTKMAIADPTVIKIEGNIITPKYKIVDLIRQTQLPNTQIFRLDTTELKDNIEQLQPIKRVYVRRFWLPARLNIIIEERTPVFLITPKLDSEPISAITDDGVLIDREYMPISPKFTTYKIITYGVRGDDYEKWNKQRVDEILKLIKSFESYSGQKVEYVDLRNPNDVYVKLEKVLVRFGEINETALKRAKWIAAILPETEKFKQKIKYIDLRWEDAHYIKLEDASQQTIKQSTKETNVKIEVKKDVSHQENKPEDKTQDNTQDTSAAEEEN